jgi:tight adherence protein B
MDPMILAVIIFFLVSVGVGAIVFALRGNSNERATQRLDQLVGRGRNNQDSSADMLLRQALDEANVRSLMDRLMPDAFNFTRVFEQADVNIRPSALFGIAIAFAVGGGLLGTIFMNIYVAPVLFLIFFSLPFLWVMQKRSSRLKAFGAQLPDAMELIARALRAGHSLATGMHVVADEMPEPISKEFKRVYEEQNLGVALEDALKNMCDRVPNLDLRFFVTSVQIQRQTGGDLAEILDRIGHIIRERFKILGQVKALTAEGRLSGIVLIALPIGLFLMMLGMKPDYIELLWKDEMGIKMSIGAIVLMIVGAYAIKKIVDIKV